MKKSPGDRIIDEREIVLCLQSGFDFLNIGDDHIFCGQQFVCYREECRQNLLVREVCCDGYLLLDLQYLVIRIVNLIK